MKRIKRLSFLLIFALLQCVAPLAHAHVGPDLKGGHFHAFHSHNAQYQDDHAARAAASGHAFHATDSPVVRVPDGKLRNLAAFSFDSPAIAKAGLQFSTPAVARPALKSDGASLRLPSPFFRQYAQAPPRCPA